MQNELGLNYACSRKVIGLFKESIKTVQEYDEKVLRIFSELKNVLGISKNKAGLQRMY